MKNNLALLLRLALGTGFLSAVADRLGYWGKPGDAAVAWGDWDHFISYTSALNFGVAKPVANILGIVATAAEVILGLGLLLGFKVKYTAMLAGLLLLAFALAMSVNTHIKSALDYSVYTASFASFLLAYEPASRWSVDYFLGKREDVYKR